MNRKRLQTIPRTTMPRPKPQGPLKTFQLRLAGEEAERWLKVFHAAKARNPYINETQVNRILLGLDDTNQAVTERDRVYFQGLTSARPKLIGRAVSGKAHISEVSPTAKTKRK